MENIENIQNTASTVKNDGLDDLFYRVELDEEESEHLAAEPYSYWKSVFKVFIRKPSAIISISVLAILLLCIFIIPSLAYEGAYSFNLDIKDLGPSAQHLWGTDNVGRDLFFISWAGAGKSLLLALISSLFLGFLY